MVPLGPPNPPRMEGIISDSLNTESDAQIIPSTEDGASGVT